MNNRSIFFRVLATALGFLGAVLTGIERSQAQTLHVVSVANTQDPQMGVEFGVNGKAIENYVKSVANTTNMKLDLVYLEGPHYSCASIETAINNLSAMPQDVILFFHSGHGRSPRRGLTDDSASIFPSLECATAEGAPLLNLEGIFELLKKKNARLLIVGADSCNEIVTVPEAKGVVPAAPAGVVRTMFLKYEGTILIASSATNEFSFYPYKSIGMFTKQFIDALTNPPSVRPELIWQQVIATATVPIDVPPPQLKQHPPHREDLRYLR